MTAALSNNGIEGLTEQIGQQLKPSMKPLSPPTTPPPIPGTEGIVGTNGEWSFHFTFDNPCVLKMIVSITAQAPPIPVPKELKFSSELDKLQITKLIEWMNRILLLVDDAI